MRVRLVIRRLRILPLPDRQHSFVEIDYELFSAAILFLPLIPEGQLSVSGERMCTVLVNSDTYLYMIHIMLHSDYSLYVIHIMVHSGFTCIPYAHCCSRTLIPVYLTHYGALGHLPVYHTHHGALGHLPVSTRSDALALSLTLWCTRTLTSISYTPL